MDKLQPPGPLALQGNLSENWRKWKQRFELYSAASGLNEKDEKIQSATLLHVIGEEALEVYNTFSWSAEGDDQKVSKITERFDDYCNPRKNVTWERHVFNTRNQQPSETIDQYVTDLKTKAKSCEFGVLTDSLIKDRIVCGITDDRTRSRLLREPDLTLQKALDICRANEATATQMKLLTSGGGASAEASGIADIDLHTVERSKAQTNKQCGRCGSRHTWQQSCPAIGAECRKCGRKNHFARACRSKPKIDTIKQEHSEDEDDDMVIDTLQKAAPKTKEWQAPVKINDKKVLFKIDTGAQCNVMSKKTYNHVSKETLQKSRTRLVTFGGHKIQACGKITLACEHKGRYTPARFEVVEQDVPSILGLKTCTEMNLIKRVDSIAHKPKDMLEEYKDVFTGLGCIEGVVHRIKVDRSHTPVVHPPRRVPVTLRSKVKNELQRMERLGVVKRVHEPTDWVNSMVIVTKPNGKLRICIDPRDLNKAIKREYYPMKTIEEVSTRMQNAKVFSVLDASSGFWQVRLDKSSAKLCTFNTPFGRYMFKRLPFGLSSAQDVFQDIMSEIFKDIEGVEVIVDELLIWGETEKQHDIRLKQVLERARHHNLKLNKDKSQIRCGEINYIGHILSKDGLKADPRKVEAIQKMDSPKNKEELQRFLGMTTYLGKFIPNMSQTAAPLRSLLEKDVEWHWEEEQNKSFETLKKQVTEAPILQYFSPDKPVKISVDASSKGMGAVLLQEEHPVAYASKALTSSQQNYAQIEKEMLAIVFGCTKFHDYIFGLPDVEVETDHKPLEMILKKTLHQAPARLQRMILTIQRYPITVKYRPGKELIIADTLSRAFLPDHSDSVLSDRFEINIIHTLPISERKLKEFKQETLQDPSLQLLKSIVENGWPQMKSEVPPSITPYWNYRDEITTHDGIMFRGAKVIVPRSMQREMLHNIHSSHLGMEKCKHRARDVLYWPAMSKQIEDFVSKCPTCHKYQRKNTREPLMSHPIPKRPWARVGADLCELNGHTYLVVVDYYSGFIEIDALQTTTSQRVITHCKSHFARHGIPDVLITDNGPQFSSDAFRAFTHDYQIKHHTSSPHYPQSNGLAEKAVQTVKNLIKKATDEDADPYLALLEFRNTPINDKLGSPVQRLMGRRTKTLIPTTEYLLSPKTVKPIIVQEEIKQQRIKQKHYYDKHAKSLKELNIGDNVSIQRDNKWMPAIITAASGTPRSYIVTTPDGQTYRRNRRHIIKNTSEQPTYLDDESSENGDNVDIEDTPNSETVPCDEPTVSSTTETEPPSTTQVRRSSRVTKRPDWYSETLTLKS